jgi:DNA-binding NarL/FixJ family response regulator
VLADDHRLVREGIRRILGAADDIVVVAEADDGHAAVEAVRLHAPRVAVIDLSMPGMTGMDLIKRLRGEWPQLAILVLTMHAEAQYALRALRAGANGYLTKDSAADELVSAIRKVASGGAYLTPALAERIALDLNGQQDVLPHTRLSDREFEVLRMIAEGKRVSDIAQALHLSVKTVSTHKSRILDKLDLDNSAALVRYSLKHHLLDDGAGES